MTVRQRASAIGPAEQQRYTTVLTDLINSGAYGDLVRIHGDMRHDQHGSMGAAGVQRFLPWHRDFLLKLEQQMQAIDGAAFIPYWRWSTDRVAPPWLANFMPSVAVPGRRNPLQVRRHIGRHGQLPLAVDVDALVNDTSLSYTEFTSQLESFHNDVHNYVGGTMGNIMISPADPLFWLHHAEVDRLWSIWQGQPANAGKTPTLTGPDLTLDPWPETAPQVLSIATLNYSYIP